MQEDEDPHDEETQFDLVDMDQQDYHEASSFIFKEKDAQIRELQTNLDRGQFVISFREQENKQLKYQQVLMELELLKTKRGKYMMPLNDPDQYDI